MPIPPSERKQKAGPPPGSVRILDFSERTFLSQPRNLVAADVSPRHLLGSERRLAPTHVGDYDFLNPSCRERQTNSTFLGFVSGGRICFNGGMTKTRRAEICTASDKVLAGAGRVRLPRSNRLVEGWAGGPEGSLRAGPGVREAKLGRGRSGTQRLDGGFGQRAYSSCRCWAKRQISPQGLR